MHSDNGSFSAVSPRPKPKLVEKQFLIVKAGFELSKKCHMLQRFWFALFINVVLGVNGCNSMIFMAYPKINLFLDTYSSLSQNGWGQVAFWKAKEVPLSKWSGMVYGLFELPNKVELPALAIENAI